MANELRTYFERYLLFTEDAFREARTRFGRQSNLPLLLSEDQLILRVVDEVETASEFADLVRATARDYHGGDNRRVTSASWQLHVYAYFRLSGLYQALFQQQEIDFTEAADRYWAAFNADTNTITYPAPLELVDLAKPCLDCGDFQIRRFTKLELDRMLGNSAKKIFYSWAYVNAAELENYWFVCARETAHSEKVGTFNFRFESEVKMPYSQHPAPIESALRKLALFNWGSSQFDPKPWSSVPSKYNKWKGPLHPKIPFVLVISDCLINMPAPAADLSVLAKEPSFDQLTGEELGEVPVRPLRFDEDAAEYLANFMRSVTEVVTEVQPYRGQWTFIE